MTPDGAKCITCGAALPVKSGPGRPRKSCPGRCVRVTISRWRKNRPRTLQSEQLARVQDRAIICAAVQLCLDAEGEWGALSRAAAILGYSRQWVHYVWRYQRV